MCAAPKGNKFAEGLENSGRPRHYKTPDDLIHKCNEYFNSTEKYTITGLALFLGFESRSSLDDYENRDEFSYIIKRARLVVENGYELMFHDGKNTAIFPLKNMGWKDRQEIEQTNIEVKPIETKRV